MKGKAKELFEEWLKGEVEYGYKVTHEIFTQYTTDSEQWGVLQDFYDSQGIDILVQGEGYEFGATYIFEIYSKLDWELLAASDEFETRQEAREAALEKANEILNEKL